METKRVAEVVWFTMVAEQFYGDSIDPGDYENKALEQSKSRP